MSVFSSILAQASKNLAASQTPISLRVAKAELRAAGLPINKYAETLVDEALRIRDLRESRAKARAIPVSSLSERLQQRRAARLAARRKAVWDAANLKRGGAGGTTFTVHFVDDPAEIGYEVETDKVWNVYKGYAKKYPAIADTHRISVAADWIERVDNAGLAIIDGLFTLDARLVDEIEGAKVYAAVWTTQGRGYDVHVHRGFIAIAQQMQHFAHHAATRAAAISGLARKIDAHAAFAAATEARAMSVQEFCRRFEGLAFDVKLADARKAGACDFGIRDWCNRTGLDYAAGSAPIGRILEAYRELPMPEARLAILFAARRCRQMPDFAARQERELEAA